MDIKDIQNLIKFVAKSGAQEVKLEMEDIKITIKTGSDQPQIETTGIVQQLQAVPAPVQLQAPPVAAAVPVAEAPINLISCSSQIFENLAFSDKNP